MPCDTPTTFICCYIHIFTIMNRLHILFFAIISVLYACNSNTDDLHKLQDQQANLKDTTISIPCLGPFIQITSIGNVNIEYSQGEYCLQATGSPELIALLNTSFDSGVLTIGMKNEAAVELSTMRKKQNIRLSISSPELKSMSICGNGDFKSSGLIKTENFQAGNLGSGNICIDSLDCRNFRFDNNNIGKALFNNVKCNSAIISTFGKTETNMSINAQTDISILSGENSKTNMDLVSGFIEILTTSDCVGEYNVECEKLNVIAEDNSNLTFKGDFKQKTIKKGRGCDIKIL